MKAEALAYVSCGSRAAACPSPAGPRNSMTACMANQGIRARIPHSELVSFSRVWFRNLQAQGFLRAEAQREAIA